MLLPENIRIGKVYRIIWDGYVYLDQIYPCNLRRRHVACFTQILGYRGQSDKELGIKIGTRALYRVDNN